VTEAGAATRQEYFRGRPESRALYEVASRILLDLGDVTERVTRSQVAYWRRRPFAWLWIPAHYLRQADLAPLVLSIGLFRRERSNRWKEVVEPRPGRFMHHLELRKAEEIDGRMRALMREAWETVGLGATKG
jgi:hypothetical protein